MTRRTEESIRRGSLLLSAVVIGAILYFGREVLIPLALAALFALVLVPVVRQLERLRIGRVASVLVIVFAGLGLIGALGWVVASQAAQLVDQLPRYRSNIVARIESLRDAARFLAPAREAVGLISKAITEAPQSQPSSGPASPPDAVEVTVKTEQALPGTPPFTTATQTESRVTAPTSPDRPTDTQPATAEQDAEPVRVEVVSGSPDLLALAAAIVLPVVSPLVTFGLALIFLIFFLIYREDLRDRLMHLSGRTNIGVTTAAIEDTGSRLTRYLAAQALANGLIGFAIGVGLFFLGIPNAALWGLLAGVLRFVPYLGPVLAATFPALLAAAIYEDWLHPIAVIALTVSIDTLSANALEPWLYGIRTGVSPTAIVVAFALWTWLWGGIGLFLAAPLTVCLVTLGKHVPAFEFFYILFGNEPVFEPQVRLYQRLLAMNRAEALHVVERQTGKLSLTELYDTILIPAAAQLQSDANISLVDAPRTQFAQTILTELTAPKEPDAAGPVDAAATAPPASPQPAALFIRGPGAYDDQILRMLGQLLALGPDQVQDVDPHVLSSEIAERVRSERPAAIIMAAIEPKRIDRILHICKRLHLSDPARPVHVALFFANARGIRQAWRLSRLRGVVVHHSLDSLVRSIAPLLGARFRSVEQKAA